MHQHIPKEVVQEYRESLKSEYASRQFHLKHPEFCERSMDYFEKMGEFAENAATKDDLNKHWEHIQDVLGRQKDINANNDRRFSSLEQRVGYIEQLSTHTKLAVDSNTAIAQQNLSLSKTISERLDEFSKLAANGSPTKPKKINISNIPAVGWVVMGIVSIAVLSLSTGHAAEFYAWLSGVKFGGVK